MTHNSDVSAETSASDEVYLISNSVSRMLSLITALLAFSGAVVAVILGQVLEMYRSDLEEAEKIIRTMRLADSFCEGRLSDSRKQQTAMSLIEDLERIYVKRQYLLSDLGKRRIESNLDYIDSEMSEDTEVSPATQLAFESVKRMDEKLHDLERRESDVVREVTIVGATKRYLGNRSPYPRRFKNDEELGWTPMDE